MGEKELKAGGVGLTLLILVPILTHLGINMANPLWENSPEASKLYYVIYSGFGIVAYVTFLAFATLLFISAMRITRRFEGGLWGKIVIILGAITALTHIMYFSFYMAGITLELETIQHYVNGILVDEYSYWVPNVIAHVLSYVTGVFIFLTMLTVGIFFLVYHRHFSHRGLWITAGMLFLIISAFKFLWLIFDFIWLFILYLRDVIYLVEAGLIITAGILGATSFFVSKAVQKEV